MLPAHETVEVFRPVKAGDQNSYPGTATHSANIHIQPQDPTLVLTDSSFAKTFRGFAELDADFQEMDKIVRVSESTKEYRITGVQRFDFGGHPHLEITLELVQ